ncbi:MAG: aminomethyl-transferring glycine dehydrogenase subunit GcvPB [Candidatus Delongbacteria bacterium]|nr:aminomethyl-transferring glycine dehydrogenase subunit GcvPB [Candidatus Delongbacteria bacterium]
MYTRLLNDMNQSGQSGLSLSPLSVPEQRLDTMLPTSMLDPLPPRLPQISEPEIVRHFTALSNKNYHLDLGFYPLGSCTMKYNPKINDRIAGMYADFHPLQPAETIQGPLQLMSELETYLSEIAGMDAVSLQPAAGAQGELTALLVARAYFEEMGLNKTEVILPDSAHGTNPASVMMAGFNVVEIKSGPDGLVDVDALKAKISDQTAMFMITNPNTLGLFETRIKEISQIVHHHQALLYMDGANLNALLGLTRPGDMGFDIVHYNLHKTFSTPHGGGGPGAGPIGVKSRLIPYLPIPRIVHDQNHLAFDFSRPKSIGKVMNFWGNFGVMVRAYAYIRMLGSEGLAKAGRTAIINANYMMRKLEPYFDLIYPSDCMHEFVLSARNYKSQGIKTLNIAKRLLDYGFHAPTIYFPLIVPEALMIEPTETESRQTLDSFIETLIAITREDSQTLLQAPLNTPIRKLNEAQAAKDLKIHW